ncbi:MAG: hypothetical protein ACYC69_16285 [Thermodesulfovibrionales bacterium]
MSVRINLSTSQKANTVNQIVTEAIATKNLKAAIEKHGKSLSGEERNVLLGLSSAELAALESLNRKLAPLGINAMY